MNVQATAAAAGSSSAGHHSAWPQADASGDTMAHMTADLDDLSNIFNIADFDLDSMQPIDSEQFGEHIHDVQNSTHTTPYLDGLAQPIQGSATHDFATTTSIQQRQHNQQFDQQAQKGFKYPPDQAYQGSAWQHYPSPQTQPYGNGMQELYTANAQVPPTPNSYEMHGETGTFLQQQQAMFAQQKRLREMESQLQQHSHATHHPAHFTPMASPSGTPQYNMQPEFTTPGAYFSPLTSPALHAQLQPNGQQMLQQAPGYFTNPSTAPSSNAPSPVELNGDVDMIDGFPEPKKSKRKLVTPRSVASSSARVRQSPIQKPQKRKSGLLSTVVPARELDGAIADGQILTNRQPISATARISQTLDSSESGSISPEPLSEALMRPPPRPSTLTQSPSGNQQTAPPYSAADIAAATLSRKAAAATPKSILSMRGNPAATIPPNADSPSTTSLLATPTATAVGQMSLDDLELPEAASKQPSRRTSVIVQSDGDGTTRGQSLVVNTARKTPKLGPQSTPSSARLDGDSPSVMLSPTSGSTPTGLLKDKKSDGRSRSLKKRGSVGGSSSALASPALRPRISPSIKPLLPEGSTLHSPTHALLLASKSNYQNLLEGNHLPGVNYPDSLSTGLTSKRTSHKVAEQGRRNRINEALKEMQSLIPAPSQLSKTSSEDNIVTKEEDDSPEAGVDCDGNETKESANAKSNSSKPATVESANRYIRLLKESDASQRAAILALKQENDEIRRRLAEATGVSDGAHTTDMPAIQELDTPADAS